LEGRGSLSGWLFRLARTVCWRHVSRRVPTSRDADLDSFEGPAPADPVAATTLQEIEDKLLSLIMALPERRRRVVIARLCVGMSTDETAKSMSCSSGTVKATLHQALASLRSAAVSGGLLDR
jgi:RNA polymerase sigma factor (sigma-70 family)